MSTAESKSVLGGEEASLLVQELKTTFANGRTRSYAWRVSQLKALSKLMNDREQQIIDALRSDLSKPPLETVCYEVFVFTICNVHCFLKFA